MSDPALIEAPFWIAVNGRRRAVLTCLPASPAALALGFLIGEGWIEDPADVHSMNVVAGPGGCSGVDVLADDDLITRAEAVRVHQIEHGCGLRHFLDCAPLPVRRTGANAVTAGHLPDAFRDLFAAARAASPAGGVHAAALSDGSTLHYYAIDVARHCAVDRAIGLACVAGDEPGRYGLVLTSRVSGAIALKAVRAGVNWIASRSLATALAEEIAAASGLPIHQNAARREPNERNGGPRDPGNAS